MKIAVIKVSMIDGISHDAMKPLIFPIIEALTPEKYDIEFWDDRTQQLPDVLDANIIAFSVETFAAKRAYYLAKKYKTEENIIVMGGFHPTILPDEAARYCDVVMTGDAEDTWQSFLHDAETNSIKSRYDSAFAKEILSANLDASCYRGKKYLPLATIQLSRGCKFNCDFCSVKTMYRGAVRKKLIDDIVGEIKAVREKLIFFVDDNLFFDESSAFQLFKAIKPLKKKWACQISIEVAKNDKLLRAMKESGCILVLIGFESLNIQSLIEMNKSANLASDYEIAIQNIYRRKILIYATFVIGLDSDDRYTASQIFEFAMKHNFAITNFNPLMPMPGTKTFDKLKSEGRLLHEKWWIDKHFRYGDTMFLPKNMTSEELSNSCTKARHDFYSYKNILIRIYRSLPRLNMYTFCAMLIANLASKKEIKRKKGKLLGGAHFEADIHQA